METLKQTDPPTHADSALAACEALLNRHPAVHEAVLARRLDTQGAERIVAYIVPCEVTQPDALRSELEPNLPRQQCPDDWVLLSAMPRADDGRIDQDALAQFAIPDGSAAQQWQRALAGTEGLGACAVVPVARRRRMGAMHRLDLLPGGRVQREVSAAARGPADSARAPVQRHGILAIADGGPLQQTADAPSSLAAALQRAAEHHPAQGVDCVRRDGTRDSRTYPQLLADAERLRARLAAHGLRPGDKVIFQLADGTEFLTAFWACELGGMVPALVSPATRYASDDPATQRLLNAWRLLDGPLILGSEERVAEIRAAVGAEASGSVHSLRELPDAEAMPARHHPQADDLALILFTSGSTGVPKGVMQTHRSLLSMAQGTAQMNGFTHRDVTLNWMPLEHVGAISFLHIMAVTLGCRQVHVMPDHILDEPLRWLDLMHEFKASISWGPNFAFKLINERARDTASRNMQGREQDKRWDLSSMRFLVSAGEQVVSDTVQRCLQLLSAYGLPPTALRPAFGMSETCSGITWSSGYNQTGNGADSPYIDLGAPIPSARLRIVDAAGGVLSEGEIGRLQVSGPSVTPGYYRNPEANAKAFTADGWFDTGDLGFLRDGHLTLTGREKDEIIVNGINYVAAEIEASVDALDGVDVSYSAACAVRSARSDADELAIFFVPAAAAEHSIAAVLKAIRSAAAAAFGVSPTYLIPVTRADIPKTSIGKIQRSQLKRRFEAGEFDAQARQADLLTDANIVPEWFYRRVWRPKAATQRRALQEGGPVVVFMDERGLGAALCTQLRAAGVACVAVEAGAEFRPLQDDRYRIDVGCAEHYRRLIRTIGDTRGPIGRIVHCFSYAPQEPPIDSVEALARAQQRGVHSLLHLVQALDSEQGDAAPVELYMVGQGTQVTAADDAVDCTHAAALGLLKTVPYEMPWLDCRHIDLADGTPDAQAAWVLDELRYATRDAEVAYRNGRRLVWELSSSTFDGAAADRAPIRHGGIYLITGGLGGIGAFLAQSLIRDYGIKAILIGTTELPPRTEWPQCLEQGGARAERVRRYLEIEALGGDCLYAASDVADLERLREIVTAAEARWNGSLAGIFHLAVAGDVAAHWADMERFAVRNETPESFERVMRAKVYGTWALYRLAQARPECIVVPFGSVLGLFGAAYFSGYCAVHTFQHNFALQQRYRAGIRSFNLCWAVWEDIGLSQGEPAFAKDFYRATGYCVIPRELGYDCLLAGLWHDQAELIVGLDSGRPQVARHVPTQAQPLLELAAFCESRAGDQPAETRIDGRTIRDAFGTAVPCELSRVDALPRRADGAIDLQALAAGRHADLQTDAADAAPQTATERQLLAIWRDILPSGRIGIHDSFFQLGGNSLGATRLMSRLRQEFNIALDMRELFAHATVHALAGLVECKCAERQDAAAPADDALHAQALLARVDQMSDSEVAALLASLQSGTGSP